VKGNIGQILEENYILRVPRETKETKVVCGQKSGSLKKFLETEQPENNAIQKNSDETGKYTKYLTTLHT
jgi:hypothetical protein